MADNSLIQWTDATWTVVQGCDPVSPGCANCYVPKELYRMAANPNRKISAAVQGLAEIHNGKLRFTGKLALREDRLTWPLTWKQPRRIFVPSHGDIFHKDVSDDFLDKLFAVMALCPQHTFQVLTKRADRMRRYMEVTRTVESVYANACADDERVVARWMWPLSNVWLGVSAEDQQRADERIPELLKAPAAVRFVSAEPLLGPIDFTDLRKFNPSGQPWIDALRGLVTRGDYLARSAAECSFNVTTQCCPPELPRLDWIIVGGESGKGARPMHPGWARDIRRQCDIAGVKFFFKQWGEWSAAGQVGDTRGIVPGLETLHRWPDSAEVSTRVGKSRAGRLLDGREHNDMPPTAAELQGA